jgi:sugar phosphate permease
MNDCVIKCVSVMSRWRLLTFLFLISVVTYVDRVNIAVAGAQMGNTLGLSRVELGAIFSAFALGYALFQVPGGWLGDHYGHKRILTFALIWWSLFTALNSMGWCQSYRINDRYSCVNLFGQGVDWNRRSRRLPVC